jgi:hypothetical protein
MEARLTEFSYGYCVTEELANGPGPRLIAAPYFPSLYTEGKKGGGFDVKIGAALFLQFKLADEMTRFSATEAQLNLLTPRFYRFWLHRRDRSNQHQMLINLENEPGNQVYYIAPRFADVNALDNAYRNRAVVERSAMFSPSEIGPLPDNRYHRIAFSRNGNSAWFLSEPQKVPVRHKKELFDRGYKAARTSKFRQLDDWLQSLTTRMIAIRHEYTKLRINIRNDVPLIERSPLDEAAYQARTHFGCELLLLAEPVGNEVP